MDPHAPPPSERIRFELMRTLRAASAPGRTFGLYRRYAAHHWDDLVRRLSEDPGFRIAGPVSDACDVAALLEPELRRRNLWGGPARAWIKDVARLCQSLAEHAGGPVQMALGPALQGPRWSAAGEGGRMRLLCAYGGAGLELLLGSEGPLRRILHCPPAWVVADRGARYRPSPSEAPNHLLLVADAPFRARGARPTPPRMEPSEACIA